MKKLVAITACLSVLFLTSCRNEQADEMFEEAGASGNVFLKDSVSDHSTARDSAAVPSIPGLSDNEPVIPPRK